MLYRLLVGSLSYLTITRPNIFLAIQQVSLYRLPAILTSPLYDISQGYFWSRVTLS
jgi:hypothetical protein